MEPFSIQWRNSTRKDIRSLPRQEVARVVEAVGELAKDPLPHGSHKLAGSERTYRLRVGDYRVVTKSSAMPGSWKSSASDTARMSIGNDPRRVSGVQE